MMFSSLEKDIGPLKETFLKYLVTYHAEKEVKSVSTNQRPRTAMLDC